MGDRLAEPLTVMGGTFALDPPRADDHATVSASTALHNALAQAIPTGAQPRVVLTRTTVREYGEATPSGVDLAIEDRLVWLVWWQDVDISGYARGAPSENEAPGDVIVPVDASTGDALGTWSG